MLNILIVDDRKDARDTLRDLIEINLPEGAAVAIHDSFPLEDIQAYASFIREHEIAALLLDERLSESKNPETGKHINYFGHQVVGHLRSSLPDFPVYVVTTHATDTDLVEKRAEFEDIVERDEFQKDPLMFTKRIQRAGVRFRESMKKHLNVLSDLTMRAAHGELSVDEQETLTATREILGLPFTSDTELVVSDLIAEARRLALSSEALIAEIKNGVSKK